ncbi:MAG: SIS domain-containing protein [Lachnospiraceae bacterium]|nr:SIS domain-containing protein [Lachnospiraceae bacterium]
MIAYFEKQLEVLGESVRSLDEGEFRRWVDEAVKTLESGHRIVVSGLGKNVPICDKFVGSMVSMGLDACFLHTNSAVHGDMGVVKDGDMVIVLTKSGETAESVYLVEKLKERSISLWLLSFAEKSTLAETVPNRIILGLRDEGDQWNIMPNNSTTMNLIILQGLAMMIARKLELPLEQFKRNHPGGAIGAVLGRSGNRSEKSSQAE